MRPALIALVAAVVLAAVGFGVWRLTQSTPVASGLVHELEGRGTVGIVSESPAFANDLQVRGTELVRVDLPALQGSDAQGLLRQMRQAGLSALLVDARGAPAAASIEEGTLAERLAAFAPVDRIRGEYLTPAAGIFVPAISGDAREYGEAMARVARTLLEGNPPPRISMFPDALRKIQNVEVMVLLRDRGQARLWRSARGSSLGQALITAATVARERWHERESAMGGPLDARLEYLDVEVSLLEEDGTLGVRSDSFVERVFTQVHGVAYERAGAWRYLLPDATARAGEGSAVRAYAKLFQDDVIPADSLRRDDLRFYRLVVSELGSSPASSGSLLDSVDLPDP